MTEPAGKQHAAGEQEPDVSDTADSQNPVITPVTPGKPGILEKPVTRMKLIRDLAVGEAKLGELGRRYGATQQSVSEFKARHAAEIREVQADLNNAFAGIVYADKAARLAELSNDVAQVAEMLADPATAARAGVQYAEMLRAKQTALRGIAEELGQLPQRLSVQVAGRLDVAVNGVDVSDLK